MKQQDIFSGIERFGLAGLVGGDRDAPVAEHEAPAPASVDGIDIKNYVFPKRFDCPVCGCGFNSYVNKEKKTRLVKVETDLRPVYTPVDPNMYDVVICPVCGYASTREKFPTIIKQNRMLIQEKISPYFRHYEYPMKLTIDMAIERYKLVLLNLMVQKPKDGERAYMCLKIMWLYNSKGDEANETIFAKLALKGFMDAIVKESPPIMGMNYDTLNYLIGALAAKLKEKETSMKYLSSVITSGTASSSLKDKARLLKEEM